MLFMACSEGHDYLWDKFQGIAHDKLTEKMEMSGSFILDRADERVY